MVRVCNADDVKFKTHDPHSSEFVSACEILEAALELLKYPPNPFADRIAKVVVYECFIPTVYTDDGRKAHEKEVIVPLVCLDNNRISLVFSNDLTFSS